MDEKLHCSFLAKSSTSDPTPTNSYTRRWHALLAENSTLQKEHLELVGSFTKPFSAQQMMQLDASAAQRHKLSLKLRDLVGDWSADARLK